MSVDRLLIDLTLFTNISMTPRRHCSPTAPETDRCQCLDEALPVTPGLIQCCELYSHGICTAANRCLGDAEDDVRPTTAPPGVSAEAVPSRGGMHELLRIGVAEQQRMHRAEQQRAHDVARHERQQSALEAMHQVCGPCAHARMRLRVGSRCQTADGYDVRASVGGADPLGGLLQSTHRCQVLF